MSNPFPGIKKFYSKRKIRTPNRGPSTIIGLIVVGLCMTWAWMRWTKPFYSGSKTVDTETVSTQNQTENLQIVRVAGLAFSTMYSVKVVTSEPDEETRIKLREAIKKELEIVDLQMSRYREKSHIYQLNNDTSGNPIAMPANTLKVLEKARTVSEFTDGAFDVTVAPLIKLWGFNEESHLTTKPSDELIEQTKKMVGYKKLEIDVSQGFVKKLSPDISLDLSAVAKGWAVDQVSQLVEKLGYKSYIVDIGGEVRAAGKKPQGKSWKVGIEKPLADHNELLEAVKLNDQAMATSGDYRNFYDLEGKKISHTIDPRTGRPITHNLASVTVIHKECAIADALATALTVLGPEEGFKLAQDNDLSVLFIKRIADEKFEIIATDQFEKLRSH